MRPINADALTEDFKGRIDPCDKWIKEANEETKPRAETTRAFINEVILTIQDAPTIEPDRPHGEWEKYGDKIEAYDISGIKTWGQKRKCTNCDFIKTYIEDFGFYSICPNCGADMSKLQANGGQVKNELNRDSKELNSEIEKSKSEIVPDYCDGWRLKEGEE